MPEEPKGRQAGARVRLLQGNEAVVEGALAAGLGFYAGYPITPANEISTVLSRRLPKQGGVFIQMEDEIASLCAVMGASLAGLNAATATSGPGFSLMQESIGYAAAAEIPCVVVDVQRAGPSTGLPSKPSQGDVMQARWGTHGDHPIIALCPSSVLEAYRLSARAFELAERYRTPVILLLDEVVAHMRERVTFPLPHIEPVSRPKVTVPPEWYFPYDESSGNVPPLASIGEGYRYHVTGLFHDRAGFPTTRLDEIGPWFDRLFHKIEEGLDDILEWQEEHTDDAETVIVAYGATARSARHAMKQARAQGKSVGLLNLLAIWPFPDDVIRNASSNAMTVVVAEMNQGQILHEVERVICGQAEVKGVLRADGEMVDPVEIMRAVED